MVRKYVRGYCSRFISDIDWEIIVFCHVLLPMLDGSGLFFFCVIVGGKWALFFHIRATLLHIQSDCYDDVLDIVYARIFPDYRYDLSNM